MTTNSWSHLRRTTDELFSDPVAFEAARRDWEISRQTLWNVDFKSRAERRVAVLLNSLGIKWEYESGAYLLENGETYVPDFFCPEIGQFIEVKSGDRAERTHKPSMFAKTLIQQASNEDHKNGKVLRVAVIWDDKLYDAWCENGFRGPTDNDQWCQYATWLQCKSCDHWYIHDMCRPDGCRAEGCGKDFSYGSRAHKHLWALVNFVEGTRYESSAHGSDGLLMAVAGVLSDQEQGRIHRRSMRAPSATQILGHPTIPYSEVKRLGL